MQSNAFKFLVLDLVERFSDKITDIFGPKPSRVYLNGDCWFTAAQEKASLKTSHTLSLLSHKFSNNSLLHRCPSEFFALPCVPQPAFDWNTPITVPPRRRSSANSRLSTSPISSSPFHSMIDLDFEVSLLDTTKNGLILRRSAPIESKPGFYFTVTPATPVNQSHPYFADSVYEADFMPIVDR